MTDLIFYLGLGAISVLILVGIRKWPPASLDAVTARFRPFAGQSKTSCQSKQTQPEVSLAVDDSANSWWPLSRVGEFRLLAALTSAEKFHRTGTAVFAAISDQRRSNPVIVKLANANDRRTSHQLAYRRLLRESEIYQSKSIPGIPTWVDSGRVDEHLYLVTQQIDGFSLQQLIQQRGALPASRVIPIIYQLCRIVETFHPPTDADTAHQVGAGGSADTALQGSADTALQGSADTALHVGPTAPHPPGHSTQHSPGHSTLERSTSHPSGLSADTAGLPEDTARPGAREHSLGHSTLERSTSHPSGLSADTAGLPEDTARPGVKSDKQVKISNLGKTKSSDSSNPRTGSNSADTADQLGVALAQPGQGTPEQKALHGSGRAGKTPLPANSRLRSDGFLHRDIQPGNLILGQDERIYLIDFGLAQYLDENIAGETGIAGTPAYLSPEAIQCKPLSSASEVYSIGCLSYFLLTGVPPCPGNNAIEICWHQIHSPPRPWTNEIETSPAVKEIVLRCLAKVPHQRPQSAAALRSLLEQHLPHHG